MIHAAPGPTVSQLEAPAPALSVVITCYNYEEYVAHAIESVLKQERADCELVVIDDGSTDASWDVISQYDVQKHRIENSGQRTAGLFGASRTTAPFIMFLDADDVLLPGALDRIVDEIDPDVAKVQFSMDQLAADGQSDSTPRYVLEDGRHRDELVQHVLRTGVYPTPPTSGNVLRRDVCALIDEAEYDRAVDGVAVFAAPFFGDVVSIAEPLAAYRVHERNMSAFGQAPTPDVMMYEMTRFEDRMRHLSRVIEERAPHASMIEPRKTYHYRQLALAHTLASGGSAPISGLPGLYASIVRERFSFRKTLSIMGYVTAATLLPRKSAASLMAYRYGSGERSISGALSSIFSPGAEDNERPLDVPEQA